MNRLEELEFIRLAIERLNARDEEVAADLENPDFIESWKAPCYRTPMVFRRQQAAQIRREIAERSERLDRL
jgi:hypothetical protein